MDNKRKLFHFKIQKPWRRPYYHCIKGLFGFFSRQHCFIYSSARCFCVTCTMCSFPDLRCLVFSRWYVPIIVFRNEITQNVCYNLFYCYFQFWTIFKNSTHVDNFDLSNFLDILIQWMPKQLISSKSLLT